MTNPVDIDLFEIKGEAVHLVAGRASESGMLCFPLPSGPERERYDRILLPAGGVLWSWTVQRFRPKEPFDGPTEEAFRPYGVGYVRLGDELIVEGRIPPDFIDKLAIGQKMRVVTENYGSRSGAVTYAFVPERARP